jgi:hypothetical protein
MPKRKLKETELAEKEQAAQKLRAQIKTEQKCFLNTMLDSIRDASQPRSDLHKKAAIRYNEEESSLKNLDFTVFVILYRCCKYTDLEKLGRTPIPEDFPRLVKEAAEEANAEKTKAESEHIVSLFRDILSLRKRCTTCTCSKQFHSGMSTPASPRTKR